PDGRLAAISTTGGLVRLLDLRSGQPHGTPLRLPGFSLPEAFSPDGRLLLTESIDGSVRVWDTFTDEPSGPPLSLNTFAFSAGPGKGAAMSLAGDAIAVIASGGELRLWRLPEPPKTLKD